MTALYLVYWCLTCSRN